MVVLVGAISVGTSQTAWSDEVEGEPRPPVLDFPQPEIEVSEFPPAGPCPHCAAGAGCGATGCDTGQYSNAGRYRDTGRYGRVPPELHWFLPPAGRYRHLGKPLSGTTWLNRPYHADWFLGKLWTDDPIRGRVSAEDDVFAGYRIGKDKSHYYGWEARLGFASPKIYDSSGTFLDYTGDFVFFDGSLLYYPWGDTAWRPYGIAGLGFASFDIVNEMGQTQREITLGMPIGFGVKYRHSPTLIFRFEFLDNVAFGGSNVDLMHNLSLTGGIELRFGGRRPSYWPWRPGSFVP